MPNELTTEQKLKCIQQKNRPWRVTPHDPYLYVSFSTNSFLLNYAALSSNLHQPYKDNKAFKLGAIRIQQIKKIITEEWVKAANLPIRFLDEDLPQHIIHEKNVVFIFGKRPDGGNLGQTVYPNMDIPQLVKQIYLTFDASDKKLTNKEINALLHETAHAFITLKHFKPYKDPTSLGPFCELSCDESIMAYDTDCLDKLKQAAINEIRIMMSQGQSFDEANAKVSENNYAELSERTVNTKLLPLDLLAARKFLAEWRHLNKIVPDEVNEASNKHSYQKILNKINHVGNQLLSASENINQTLANAIDRMGQYACAYAKDVVDSCPSYFAPGDVTSIRNQHLFVQSNDDDNSKTPLMLANQPTGLFYQPVTSQLPVPMLLTAGPNYR